MKGYFFISNLCFLYLFTLYPWTHLGWVLQLWSTYSTLTGADGSLLASCIFVSHGFSAYLLYFSTTLVTSSRFSFEKLFWTGFFFLKNLPSSIVSPALLSISSLYGFTISILQIRWRTLWMVQTDAYRSPEVGSVVFYPLELVGHFAVRGSQIGESWFFWLYFRNFKITPKLSLEGPFYLTHVCREWNGLSNGILEYIVKIIDDNGRFLKKIEKNRAESQNRHFFRKLWPCGYTHWLSQKAK